jgi:hypothetical protein
MNRNAFLTKRTKSPFDPPQVGDRIKYDIEKSVNLYADMRGWIVGRVIQSNAAPTDEPYVVVEWENHSTFKKTEVKLSYLLRA